MLPLFLVAPLLGACASMSPEGSVGDPISRSRAVSDAYVTVLDQSPREPVEPSAVVILSAVGEVRPLPGCTIIGRLHLETTSQLQAQTAAVNTAARMGATAVIIGVAEQRTAHDAASKRGMGATTISTRYQIDAIDCR
jgi:hypothetical protein